MNEIWQAILLGLVQGITEFLPVSSSGHLVILEELLAFEGPRLFFNILLHLATLLVIALYFRQQIIELCQALPSLFKRTTTPARTLLLGIIVASIPTALLGLLIKRYEGFIFHSLALSCGLLLVTGLILLASRMRQPTVEESQKGFLKKACLVGIAQGLAVLPGISRSGATISCGILSGIERRRAFTFAFLVSLPAIFGAMLLELREINQVPNTQWLPFFLGFVVAFISGYLSLKLLSSVVQRGRLAWFAPYCFILGTAGLIYHFFLR